MRADPSSTSQSEASAHGRLNVRAAPTTEPSTPASLHPGVHPLSEGRPGGLLMVPATYRPEKAAPLIVFFHGAGGDAHQSVNLIQAQAEKLGAFVLAPSSAASTWDVIVDEYGPDVASLNQNLESVLRGYNIDTRRLVVGGFSDGASYALSLALTNGDLFTHVWAFSPGFAAPNEIHGASRFFISHGTQDRVLPVDRCSRRLVPRLKSAGYDVDYLEFQGGHAVPQEVLESASRWLE